LVTSVAHVHDTQQNRLSEDLLHGSKLREGDEGAIADGFACCSSFP
jgi:hypothetical protein